MVSPETLARIEASRERYRHAMERDADHMDRLYWSHVFPHGSRLIDGVRVSDCSCISCTGGD
jgi:hypothetical protein